MLDVIKIVENAKKHGGLLSNIELPHLTPPVHNDDATEASAANVEPALEPNEIQDVELMRQFFFGGRAVFTLQSLKTGMHYTYEVSTYNDDAPFFVRLRTGDGESFYMCTVFDRKHIKLTKKSCFDEVSTPYKAVKYFFDRVIVQSRELPALVKFFHEGQCCKCSRPLTNPLSIKLGIGPTCRGKSGI
jgi:hypothetical protein